MKYILIIWYLITPPLGDSVTGPGHEDMPDIHGAAIEPLNYDKSTIILGRFKTKVTCEEKVDEYAKNHLAGIDIRRVVKAAAYGCFRDPQYD